MQTQLKAQTLKQPAGEIITLKLCMGAVFGIFRVGRGRYRIAVLEPGREEGWLDCESPDEPDFSYAEAKSILAEHMSAWLRAVIEGDF